MPERPTEMNFAGLQARLVPLVAELFATLATRNPLRMHFADIAGKTLHDIVQVLRQDGISQEAIAASLGLTINGYNAKMKRLRALHQADPAEAAGGEEARTLLERVHAYVAEQGGGEWVLLRDLQRPFRGVKPDSLRGVLTFLVRTGFLEVKGRGAKKRYRVVERPSPSGPTEHDAAAVLYREGPMTAEALAARLGVSCERAAELVEALRGAGRLRLDEGGGELRYRATGFHIPLDTARGYEAAIYDHFAAVVGAVCKKLRLGRHSATLGDRIGGATFTYRVPRGHPLHDEITGFLADARVRLERWLEEAEALAADGPVDRVTVYVGQNVEEED